MTVAPSQPNHHLGTGWEKCRTGGFAVLSAGGRLGGDAIGVAKNRQCATQVGGFEKHGSILGVSSTGLDSLSPLPLAIMLGAPFTLLVDTAVGVVVKVILGVCTSAAWESGYRRNMAVIWVRSRTSSKQQQAGWVSSR
jgi:hypothetical protein